MHKSQSSFLTGPIFPSLLRFALPVAAALLLQALYGAVDMWAVGTFATAGDVSAVSSGGQTMLLFIVTVSGLSMGATVLIGQRLGQGHTTGAAFGIGNAVRLFTILGILLTPLVIFGAPFLAQLVQAPKEAYAQTVDYIRICGFGMIFIVGYNVIGAIFRGVGNSKIPLLTVSVACAVNIIGDVILIGYFGMGTAGAAIATVAAQGISVLLSLWFLLKGALPFQLTKEHFKFRKTTTFSILKIGAPIALQDGLTETTYMIIIMLVNGLGVIPAAGVGIAEKLISFMVMIFLSFNSSLAAFVAQNTGAGLHARARRSMWIGMTTSFIISLFTFYLAFFHGDLLASIFISDPAVIAAAQEFMKATSIECLIMSVAFCFTGYFNGIGKTTFVMVQGLTAVFLVRIPIAYIAATQPNPKLFWIGFSALAAAAFTLTAAVLYYIYLKYKRKKYGEQFCSR